MKVLFRNDSIKRAEISLLNVFCAFLRLLWIPTYVGMTVIIQKLRLQIRLHQNCAGLQVIHPHQ